MSAMASQITSLSTVYLTVYSGTDQRKHQSSASLAFVRGIHRSPVNSSHKGPVTRKGVSIWWRHHDLTNTKTAKSVKYFIGCTVWFKFAYQFMWQHLLLRVALYPGCAWVFNHISPTDVSFTIFCLSNNGMQHLWLNDRCWYKNMLQKYSSYIFCIKSNVLLAQIFGLDLHVRILDSSVICNQLN